MEPPLPPPSEERFRAIRRDKGLRVAAALEAASPRGHVMVVDWDDLVSKRLGSFVAENPEANGWYAPSGYAFSDFPLAMKITSTMHNTCGSTIIHNIDRLMALSRNRFADLEFVDAALGSHIMSKGMYERAGFPLSPLPFPVGAYRVGTGANVSGMSNPLKLGGAPLRRRLLQVCPRSVIRQFEPAR